MGIDCHSELFEISVRVPAWNQLATHGRRSSAHNSPQNWHARNWLGTKAVFPVGSAEGLFTGHIAPAVQGLLGLEAVDGKDDLLNRFVLLAEQLGILSDRGEHDLITSDVLLDGVFGELDPVVVLEFGLDRGRQVAADTVDVRSSRRRPRRSPSKAGRW